MRNEVGKIDDEMARLRDRPNLVENQSEKRGASGYNASNRPLVLFYFIYYF